MRGNKKSHHAQQNEAFACFSPIPVHLKRTRIDCSLLHVRRHSHHWRQQRSRRSRHRCLLTAPGKKETGRSSRLDTRQCRIGGFIVWGNFTVKGFTCVWKQRPAKMVNKTDETDPKTKESLIAKRHQQVSAWCNSLPCYSTDAVSWDSH